MPTAHEGRRVRNTSNVTLVMWMGSTIQVAPAQRAACVGGRYAAQRATDTYLRGGRFSASGRRRPSVSRCAACFLGGEELHGIHCLDLTAGWQLPQPLDQLHFDCFIGQPRCSTDGVHRPSGPTHLEYLEAAWQGCSLFVAQNHSRRSFSGGGHSFISGCDPTMAGPLLHRH